MLVNVFIKTGCFVCELFLIFNVIQIHSVGSVVVRLEWQVYSNDYEYI